MSAHLEPSPASLKYSAPIDKSVEISRASAILESSNAAAAAVQAGSSRAPDQQRIEDLQNTLQGQTARITELETALRESRKIIDNREHLINSLQFHPREDYYSYQNLKVTDKSVKEAQEFKLKCLIAQMRVMEATLEDRDRKLTASMHLAQSMFQREQSMYGGASTGSPALASPKMNGSSSSKSPKTPKAFKWGSSSVASPTMNGSPQNRPKKSGSWWFGGGSRKNSIYDNRDITTSSQMSSANLGNSSPAPQSSRAKTTVVV